MEHFGPEFGRDHGDSQVGFTGTCDATECKREWNDETPQVADYRFCGQDCCDTWCLEMVGTLLNGYPHPLGRKAWEAVVKELAIRMTESMKRVP